MTLLSGTTLAMAVSFAAQPVLTRLYPPESFGVFSALQSILTILIPLASLRYEDALMIPDRDEDALPILGLSLCLVAGASILSVLLIYLAPWIYPGFARPELYAWLLWLPPMLIAVRYAKLGELWLSRQKKYATVSNGLIAQSGVNAALRIGIGRISGAPLGLFVGYLAGQLTTAVWYTAKILRPGNRTFLHAFDRKAMWHAMKRFKGFPRYSMPSTFLIALNTRLPFLLLLYFFDEAAVGHFDRAWFLFAIPLSLFGNSIAQVFFVEGTEAHRLNRLSEMIVRVHRRLIMIGLFPTLGMIIAGPHVFAFILGDQWVVAGEYARWITPWIFLSSLAAPLTRVFDILEKQRLDLFTSIVMFVIQTAALIAGGITGELITCLLYLCVGGCAARVIQLTAICWLGKVPIRRFLADYLTYLALAAPFLVALGFIARLGHAWLTTLAFALGGAAFLGLGIRLLSRKPR